MKRVAFQTLGCKLNFAESSTIGHQFIERGFDVVEADQPCDVFVINTCTVTGRADRECRQMIRRALRHSPEAYVIVVGCYSQLHPEDIASIQGVDLILGSEEKYDLFKHADTFTKKPKPDIFVSCIDEVEEVHPAFSSDFGARTRAFLKIQDGCDYSCSFCTIPQARGKSRSIGLFKVMEEAEQIAAGGYKEIVLTGVNVGDYGRKMDTDLLSLLKEIDGIGGIERIRISSIEPNLLKRELIDFILGNSKFCNHFHIPLQSGSNFILKNMRRRYNLEFFRDLVYYTRGQDPSAAIGIDVIVGFPGETESLFNETFAFLNELPFSYLHVFTYSERANTVAAALSGGVEPRVRHQRSGILRELGKKKREAFYSSFIGRSLPVLFEGDCKNCMVTGWTPNYIRVSAPGSRSLTGEIKNTRIIKVEHDVCTGIIEDPSLGLKPKSPLLNKFSKVSI